MFPPPAPPSRAAEQKLSSRRVAALRGTPAIRVLGRDLRALPGCSVSRRPWQPPRRDREDASRSLRAPRPHARRTRARARTHTHTHKRTSFIDFRKRQASSSGDERRELCPRSVEGVAPARRYGPLRASARARLVPDVTAGRVSATSAAGGFRAASALARARVRKDDAAAGADRAVLPTPSSRSRRHFCATRAGRTGSGGSGWPGSARGLVRRVVGTVAPLQTLLRARPPASCVHGRR